VEGNVEWSAVNVALQPQQLSFAFAGCPNLVFIRVQTATSVAVSVAPAPFSKGLSIFSSFRIPSCPSPRRLSLIRERVRSCLSSSGVRSFVFNGLRTLLRFFALLFRASTLCFQGFAHSLTKTPGVGVPPDMLAFALAANPAIRTAPRCASSPTAIPGWKIPASVSSPVISRGPGREK
jgi:hypothetical protein